MQEFTGFFWYKELQAIEVANQFTKDHKEYFTAIKGDPDNRLLPDQCWAVTNRYDPRIKKPGFPG